MSQINIVFQEKGKQNVIIKGKTNMTFSELILAYFKFICASKKDRMTKLFCVKGNQISQEESQTLNELGLHDYSEIEIQSTEKIVTGSSEPPKKKEEPAHEEPPQEEAPQEEAPQEEAPQEEPPQEEQPQEEQPQEEHPQEEQPQEEQPQEEQPQENNDDGWD